MSLVYWGYIDREDFVEVMFDDYTSFDDDDDDDVANSITNQLAFVAATAIAFVAILERQDC